VSPDDVLNLPGHRRPPRFHGTGKDPVFWIDDESLPDGLVYRDDPDLEGHGFIEPARLMRFEDCERLIRET